MAFYGFYNPFDDDDAPSVDMTQAPPNPPGRTPQLPIEMLSKIMNDRVRFRSDGSEDVQFDTELVAQGSKVLHLVAPLTKSFMKVLGSGPGAYQVGTEDRNLMLQVDISFGDAVDIRTDGSWMEVVTPMYNLSQTMKDLVNFAKLKAPRYISSDETAQRVVRKLQMLFPLDYFHEQSPVPLTKYQKKALEEYQEFLDLLVCDTRKPQKSVFINTAELFYKDIMRRAQAYYAAGKKETPGELAKNLRRSMYTGAIYKSQSGEYLRMKVQTRFMDNPGTHFIFLETENWRVWMNVHPIVWGGNSETHCRLMLGDGSVPIPNVLTELAFLLNRSVYGVLMDIIFFFLRAYFKFGSAILRDTNVGSDMRVDAVFDRPLSARAETIASALGECNFRRHETEYSIRFQLDSLSDYVSID